MSATQLRKGDHFLVEARDVIPADGEVVERMSDYIRRFDVPMEGAVPPRRRRFSRG